MSHPRDQAAWADFWARNNGRESGCLPHASVEIDAAQKAVWRGFARALPKRAKVLDLGTGDGAVLKKMRDDRGDLQLTGVDSSPRLPAAPRGISLRAGLALERLPFPPATFDAVTSQFGYEYGETAQAAPECARVLKPGGTLLFILHRSDSPIVAHNLPRRDALRWVLATGGYFDKARALVTARAVIGLPTPPAFSQAPEEAGRRFPGQSVGTEFLSAVLQTLEMGRRRPAVESLEVLQELESKALNEIARINSLERAACDASRIEEIAGELRAAGFDIPAPGAIVEQSSRRPFAWLVSGTKRGSAQKGTRTDGR